LVTEWLSSLGLELKASKIRISHTLNYHQGNCGFDFLGFQVRQFPIGKTPSGRVRPHGQEPRLLGFKTIITLSKEAQKRHLQALKEVILTLRSTPQKVLIAQLSSIIRGRCNYFSKSCSKKTFSKMDHLMFKKLLRWARKRHPNKGLKWVVRKYWRLERGTWDFALREGIRLKRHDEVAVRRHIKVRSTKSPFDGD
jgi:RNA-directed DNA polymerase